METALRKKRGEIALLEAGGASEDDILAAKAKYHALSNEYAEFSKAMNLPQQRERISVDGRKGVDVSFAKPAEKAENPVAKSAESGIIKADKKFEPLPPEKVVPTLREESKEWVEKLTDEETRSIKKYTKNSGDPADDKFYARLNAMLRGKIPENDTLEYYSNQISSAILKFKLKHDIVCYRNMDFNPFAGVPVGKIIVPKQFISSSVRLRGALDNEFQFKIFTPKGSKGAYIELISQYPKQREFLFDKSCAFKVLAIDDKHMELEVIV